MIWHQRRLAGNVLQRGFTLVELLVVVAIIGVLMSLMLAAVQASRETARRASCANNIKNQGLALQEYCALHQRFPAGITVAKGVEYSWCVESLSFIDQDSLVSSLDRSKPWEDPANYKASHANLKIFRCPSALKKFEGKTDYGGIMGSILSGATINGIGLDNGILVEVSRASRRPLSVRLGEITDGTSNTIVIGECSDRDADGGGRWVSGLNCFSQDNGGVNATLGDDLYSYHPGGAYAAFADGRVQFLSKNTADFVLGAICTRSGGELVNDF
jgi:prepilin-type N-terminal cleavage/methylation domain-containing protein/prepilin-type processing-associated H-X9-DG protein